MVTFLVAAAINDAIELRPIVLFNGRDTSEWIHRGGSKPCEWRVDNGELVVTPGKTDIMTKREFSDYTLHLEFKLPVMLQATSQGRANSGVYNLGRYEMQILDSWNNPTYAFGGCGAIYGEKEPDKFALQPPGTWNRYDIEFTAPRFDSSGKQTSKPKISAWQNGIQIHKEYEIQASATAAGIEGSPKPTGPILLQNHGAEVRFRNIWIIPRSH